MIEFGIGAVLIAAALAILTLAGALATRIARRDDDGEEDS